MSAEANKALVMEYLNTLSGTDKPAEVVDRYVSDSDPELKQHIRDAEIAFPHYQMMREAVIADGDIVALRFRMQARHAATGKEVDVPGQIWYRMQDGKIAQHWIVMDNQVLTQQLSAAQPEATELENQMGR